MHKTKNFQRLAKFLNGIEIEHNEIKDYKWITLEEYKESGIKAYIPYLEKIIEKYGNSN